MSTIISILREAEMVQLPDGRIMRAADLERAEQVACVSERSARARGFSGGSSFSGSSGFGSGGGSSSGGLANIGVAVSDNSNPGNPSVRVVGRARPGSKPIQTAKSKIVPEPDQIQSKPPTRQNRPELG
jgi:hypothetical protein